MSDTELPRPPEHDEIIEFSRRRRLLMWVWVVTTTLLMLGSLVVANLIAYRKHKRFDLTREKSHTIEASTRETLAKIDMDVDIFVTFLDSAGPDSEDLSLAPAYDMLKSMLEEFGHANPKIHVKLAEQEGDAALNEIKTLFKEDPTANMVYMVARQGDRILKQAFPLQTLYQGDPRTGSVLIFFAEPRLTSALIQASTRERLIVYYTTGHRELSPTRPDKIGLTALARILDSWANTELRELDFSKTPEVPPCNALLIAGFSGDLTPPEVNILENYLKGGGRLFVSLAMEAGAGRGLTQLLERWGVRINDEIVLDRESAKNIGDITFIPVMQFGDHDINRGMVNVAFFFPTTRSVEAVPGENRSVAELMYAPPSSWAQPMARKNPNEDPGDRKAPPVAACAMTRVAPGKFARVIAWGSYLALCNGNLSQGTQLRDDQCGYVLNNFRWLLDQEGLIVAPPKRLDRRPLILKEEQFNLMFIIVVVVMPLVGVVLGGIAYFFRRK